MEAIMLELQKKQIHMSRSKNTVSAQVTFDEDFNIPDAKPDVGSVLLKQADAVMEELRQLSEKVIIKGRLDFICRRGFWQNEKFVWCTYI